MIITENDKGLQVTLTANAGVILRSQNRCILIDALHNEQTQDFSSVSDAELGQIEDLLRDKHPDMALATHRHPDHCSEGLIRRFSKLWPDTEFLFPEDFPKGRLHSCLNDIQLTSMSLIHEGKGFENTDQRGYCITLEGITVLHAGDCALSAGQEIIELTEGRTIDIAIMNFPWITLSAGRAFLENTLKPKHLLVVHVPFEDQDKYGYRKAVFKAAEAVRLPDVRVMSQPMQTETII